MAINNLTNGNKIATAADLQYIIKKLLAKISTAKNELNSDINANTAAIEAEVTRAQNAEQLLSNALSSIQTDLTTETSNRAQADSNLDNRITTVYNELKDLISEPIDMTEIEAKIAEAIEALNIDSKLNNSGDETLTGSLIIAKTDTASGNLTVQGNLTVEGTTITKDHETSLVKDNFIVINSDGEELSNTAGITIRKNETEAYGIVYDPTNDAVSLGVGTIDNETKDFTFSDGVEKKPILTRADSTQFEEDHLLAWDKDNTNAKDSGHSITDITNLKIDVTNLKNEQKVPIDHASSLTDYGIGTSTKYGHVRVASELTDSFEDPVQGKVIKKYVDDNISSMQLAELNPAAGQTIKKLKQEKGKITAEVQNIQIEKNQVTNLTEDLSNINTNIIDLGNDIAEEASSRVALGTALQNSINDVQKNLTDNTTATNNRIIAIEDILKTLDCIDDGILN